MKTKTTPYACYIKVPFPTQMGLCGTGESPRSAPCRPGRPRVADARAPSRLGRVARRDGDIKRRSTHAWHAADCMPSKESPEDRAGGARRCWRRRFVVGCGGVRRRRRA
eukprot:3047369-Pleurochrysis_carterae.AAC.2